MAWRYKFDDGDEQSLPNGTTLYQVAAMAAFAREHLQYIPQIEVGVHPYDGHVVELWDRDMIDYDPPRLFGVAYNTCGSLQIVTLGHK